MVSRRNDVTFDLNETWTFQITCHDDNDATIVSDLTGASISLKLAVLSTGVTIMTAPGVILNPSTAGVAIIQISPAAQQAAGVVQGHYTYTIRVVRADSTTSDQAYGTISVRSTEYG